MNEAGGLDGDKCQQLQSSPHADTTYRAVVALDVLWLIKLVKDVLREHLAELDTHLVCERVLRKLWRLSRIQGRLTERVDAPDNTLREDLVLIKRNECTEGSRGEDREDDAVAWTVALENLRLDERVGRIGAKFLHRGSRQRGCPSFRCCSAHLADLLFSLAERQRFWLSEEVAEQDAVVLRVGDRVVSGGGCEEVGWDELRALVYELVERVLAVRARCSPDNRLDVITPLSNDIHVARG